MWLVNETVGSFHRAEHGAMSAILKTLGGAIFLLTKCIICSKTRLDSELDTIKQLLIDNGYPEDVLVSCIRTKLANLSSEKRFGPGPVYLKLPWIGKVSLKFENQINKAIIYCFYAVKPRAVYNTRVMLPSVKKDSFPTTQKSCVVYEFSCRCEAR